MKVYSSEIEIGQNPNLHLLTNLLTTNFEKVLIYILYEESSLNQSPLEKITCRHYTRSSLSVQPPPLH